MGIFAKSDAKRENLVSTTITSPAGAARGAAVSLVAQVFRFIIQMVGLALLSRLLEPSAFGLLAMILAVVGLATVLGDFGLSLAAVQAPTLSQAQKSALFWVNALIGVLAGVCVFCLSGPLAIFYERPELTALTQLLALVFLLNALSAQFRVELTRRLDFVGLAWSDALGPLGGLTIGVGMALAGFGVWALAWQQIAGAGFTLAVLVVRARWVPGSLLPMPNLRNFLAFGVATTSTQVLNYASVNIASVAVGKVLGASTLGIYSRAFQIFMLPLQQMAAPLTRVALPILSRLVGDERYSAYVCRAQLLMSYSLVPALLAMALVAEPVVRLVLGPGWEDAGSVLRILCFGGVFQALGYTYYWVFLSKARMGVMLGCELVGRVVMIALTLALANFGIDYVAAAYSIGLFMIWLVSSAFGLRLVGISAAALLGVTLRPVSLFFGIFVLIAGADWLLDFQQYGAFVHLGILVTLSMLLFAIAIAALRSLRSDLGIVLATGRMALKR
ncbi:lipopolysaccharide biosynthesis protein [Cryobacterium frigoriphilum]|uniref:lipopolysaccharide biosynthesis protein n=1 Tax=Cryobacterium frigoriphilum TaxID=1259150 RepID=UPI00141AB8BB|nr:lipopolysaccharide biosynthesis protein [Cryobacterium frigoriphilum]